jgi:putative acetyltransferase
VNITIRHTEVTDADAIHRIFTGPNVVRGTLQLPHPSVELWRKRLAEPAEGVQWLCAAVDGEVVGHLGLHTTPTRPRRRHAAGIGMAIHDDWQGKGIGTALLAAAVDMADNWLGITRLELTVFADNSPAVRLYEKFGFVVEGTLAAYALRAGRYEDVYTMARIRPSRPN